MKVKPLTYTIALLVAGAAHADLPGKFDGVTLQAKLIGGQQYEALYSRIADWEAATGAKVEVISKKSHFEIDKEIKSDMAAGTTDWCVGSNHSSFAPQYIGLYQDLEPLLADADIDAYVPAIIGASKVGGELIMLPRAQFDVSALYYQKSLFEDADNQAKFKEKYGYDLKPAETWAEVSDQAKFFADPPNFYGTQFAGKDEGLSGRFYEMLIAEGGAMFDEAVKPSFNSEAGVRALNWFVDMYASGAVPKGTTSYLWDELGAGFASGNVAINLDWPGWAGYFNDPEASKVANNVGVVVQPKGSAGIRTGWSGHHGFSVTSDCANPDAAASLVWFLTNEDSQKHESAGGSLPTRTAVWEHVINTADSDYRKEVLATFSEAAQHAFPVPSIAEWIEASNVLFPELQAAIVGEKTAQEALDDAAEEIEEVLMDAGYY